jgi:hypothetical protein
MAATGSEDVARTRVPRGDVEAGHLRIERGLDGARIATDPRLGDLLHGAWKWAPKVGVEGGEVTLTYPRFRLARLGTDDITLNASVPWDISIQGGVRRVSADLRGLKLRSLEVDGGASRLVLLLGKPDGDVQLDLKSADGVTVRRPENTEVRVRVAKGASQVMVDDQTYGAIGGDTVITTGPVVRNAYYLNVIGARRLRVTTL